MALNFYLIKQGLTLRPRSSAPSAPSNGAFYYDSTLNRFRAYENGSFQTVLTSATTQLSIADGAVGAPAYSFSSDPDTGMYRIASNRLLFSAGGSNGFEVNDSYNRAYRPIFVENGTVGAPSYSFVNDQTTGFYRASGSSISFGIAGAQVMNFQPTEITSNTHVKLTGQSEVRLNNSGNTFYTAIRAQNPTANYTITLPSAAPGSNTFLKFDGTNYTWGTPVTGTGDINNGGNATGADISIGTNDAFALILRMNNVNRVTFNSAGSQMQFAPPSAVYDINTSSSANELRIGSGTSASDSQGASILMFGNTFATAGSQGDLQLRAGNTANGNIDFSTGGLIRGSLSFAGAWTLGETSGTQSHVVNGSIDASTATSAWGIGSTGAAANSSLLIYTASGSTGDALITFRELAGTEWSLGRDDSDSAAFKVSQSTALGTNDFFKLSSGGLVTLGASGGTQTHVVNGSVVNFTPSTASSDMTLQHGQQQGRLILSSDNRGFSTRGGAIVLYGNGHATLNDNIEFYRAGTLIWNMASSGGVVYTTTPGTIVAGRQLFANSTANDNNSIISVGNSTPSVTGSTQIAFNSSYAGSSNATSAIYGFLNQTTTAAASFTAAIRAGFYHANIAKGAGSTITRDIGFLVEKPTQGTNNASISDNTAFTSSWFINQTGGFNNFFSGNQTWQTGASGTHTFKTDSGNFGPNVRLEVSDSATTADAIMTFTNNAGAQPWTMGRDTSDSQKFKIAQRDGGFVGTNEFFTITLGGLVTIGDSPTNGVQHVVNGRWLDIQTNSAGDAGLLVTNNNTGSGANAEIEITAATSTSGDSKVRFNITGGDVWSHGVDNSDSDAYVISNNGNLGTSNVLRLQGTTATFGNRLLLPDGGSSTPAISFSGQTAFGFYRVGTDTLRLSGGDDTTLSVWNAGSNDFSLLELTNNGSSSGDQFILMKEGGVTADQWSMGRDDSDSGSWKVSQAATLGTNDYLKVTTVGDVKVPSGTSTTLVGVGGAYSVNVAEANNSGTGETDLQSFTIAANSLNADGDALEFEWFGTTTGANTKTLRLYVDGVVQQTMVLPTNNSRFQAKIYIHRSTTNVVKGYTEILSRDGTPTGNLVTEYIEKSVTLTSSFVVKLTGQSNVGSNEITSRGARADWKATN